MQKAGAGGPLLYRNPKTAGYYSAAPASRSSSYASLADSYATGSSMRYSPLEKVAEWTPRSRGPLGLLEPSSGGGSSRYPSLDRSSVRSSRSGYVSDWSLSSYNSSVEPQQQNRNYGNSSRYSYRDSGSSVPGSSRISHLGSHGAGGSAYGGQSYSRSSDHSSRSGVALSKPETFSRAFHIWKNREEPAPRAVPASVAPKMDSRRSDTSYTRERTPYTFRSRVAEEPSAPRESRSTRLSDQRASRSSLASAAHSAPAFLKLAGQPSAIGSSRRSDVTRVDIGRARASAAPDFRRSEPPPPVRASSYLPPPTVPTARAAAGESTAEAVSADSSSDGGEAAAESCGDPTNVVQYTTRGTSPMDKRARYSETGRKYRSLARTKTRARVKRSTKADEQAVVETTDAETQTEDPASRYYSSISTQYGKYSTPSVGRSLAYITAYKSVGNPPREIPTQSSTNWREKIYGIDSRPSAAAASSNTGAPPESASKQGTQSEIDSFVRYKAPSSALPSHDRKTPALNLTSVAVTTAAAARERRKQLLLSDEAAKASLADTADRVAEPSSEADLVPPPPQFDDTNRRVKRSSATREAAYRSQQKPSLSTSEPMLSNTTGDAAAGKAPPERAASQETVIARRSSSDRLSRQASEATVIPYTAADDDPKRLSTGTLQAPDIVTSHKLRRSRKHDEQAEATEIEESTLPTQLELLSSIEKVRAWKVSLQPLAIPDADEEAYFKDRVARNKGKYRVLDSDTSVEAPPSQLAMKRDSASRLAEGSASDDPHRSPRGSGYSRKPLATPDADEEACVNDRIARSKGRYRVLDNDSSVEAPPSQLAMKRDSASRLEEGSASDDPHRSPRGADYSMKPLAILDAEEEAYFIDRVARNKGRYRVLDSDSSVEAQPSKLTMKKGKSASRLTEGSAAAEDAHRSPRSSNYSNTSDAAVGIAKRRKWRSSAPTQESMLRSPEWDSTDEPGSTQKVSDKTSFMKTQQTVIDEVFEEAESASEEDAAIALERKQVEPVPIIHVTQPDTADEFPAAQLSFTAFPKIPDDSVELFCDEVLVPRHRSKSSDAIAGEHRSPVKTGKASESDVLLSSHEPSGLYGYPGFVPLAFSTPNLASQEFDDEVSASKTSRQRTPAVRRSIDLFHSAAVDIDELLDFEGDVRSHSSDDSDYAEAHPFLHPLQSEGQQCGHGNGLPHVIYEEESTFGSDPRLSDRHARNSFDHRASSVPSDYRAQAMAADRPTFEKKKRLDVLSPWQRAVESTLRRRGSVTIAELLTICRLKRPRRAYSDSDSDVDEETFIGYGDLDEMLLDMGVDTKKLEDCTLQLYRHSSSAQGEYGTYLDLEATLDEQSEEIEGFGDQRKNSLLLRTQLSVRVHAVIEKLLNSDGRELRRALFSLKQIFQDDKDLVHEFVNSDGLDCLIKVGSEADQNHQNYILRALGQVMLYVDGMNGVIAHNETIQWLYSLISSKYRLVAKTALKLLLVFVEYADANALLLIKAVTTVDSTRGAKPWVSIIDVLSEKDGGDSELCLFAMTLVNKTLSAIPDQDTFYDMTDYLEEQGMENVIKRHVNKKGTDLDLITQLNLYEAALKHEDGEEEDMPQTNQDIRQMPRVKSEGRISRRSMVTVGSASGSPRTQRRTAGNNSSRATPEPATSQPPPPSSSQQSSVQASRQAFEGQSQNGYSSGGGGVTEAVPRRVLIGGSPQEPVAAPVISDRRLPERTAFSAGTGEPAAGGRSSTGSSGPGRGSEHAALNGSAVAASTEQPSSYLERRRAERLARKAESAAALSGATGAAPSAEAAGSNRAASTTSATPSPRKYERRSALQDVSAVLQSSGVSSSGSIATSPVATPSTVDQAAQGMVGGISPASSIASAQKSPQSNLLRQNRRERHLSHYRQHSQQLNDSMGEPMAEGHAGDPGVAAATASASTPGGSSDGSVMGDLDEPLYVRRLRDQHNTSTPSAVKPELQRLHMAGLASGGLASDKPAEKVSPHEGSNDIAVREHAQPGEAGSRSSRDMTNRLSRTQQNLLDDQGKVVSPLTPGIMSNNRRWMLYKMAKQSSEELPPPPEAPPAQPPSPRPPVVEGIVSRLEGGQQRPEGEPAAAPPLGGSPLTPPVGAGNVLALAGKLASGSGHDDAAVASISAFPSSASSVGVTVSVAKEKLAASTASAAKVTSPPAVTSPASSAERAGDADSRWESIEKAARMKKLHIRDLDFTDLTEADDADVLQPVLPAGGVPFAPPPPLMPSGALLLGAAPPAPPLNLLPPPPPQAKFGAGPPPPPPPQGGVVPVKSRKTIRLHWTEASASVPPTLPQLQKQGTIWKNLKAVAVDSEQLCHLFENRSTEAKAKDGAGKGADAKKLITVLDSKRSNAINIGLTKLPPPRTIKAAILKMDSSIMTREGVEKILTIMMPTEEEMSKIMEAQVENPDVPLGTAEQCLIVLSSVSELRARLELWLFKLDYDQNEKDIAEPLQDLKQGLLQLQFNTTFQCILATILSIGNFLNGVQNQGFHIEYLSKIPEVKDTVHKHSLLHHVCVAVIEKFPDSSDLYSEVNCLARCSKVDWDELREKLRRLEVDCRKSMDNLRLIAKHDTQSNMRIKLSEFLSDCAERIVVLQIVWGRVMNRYYKLLMYLGLNITAAKDFKVGTFCKVIGEFALEYRTTREKVLQQNEKKKTYKERKKTRGKLIVEVESDSAGMASDVSVSGKKEKENEDQLKNILKNGYTSDVSNMSGSMGRRRQQSVAAEPTMSVRTKALGGSGAIDADDTGDEVLEAAFRTAASTRVRSSEERKRSQYRHRKSLRRTLKGGLNDVEKLYIEQHATQQEHTRQH